MKNLGEVLELPKKPPEAAARESLPALVLTADLRERLETMGRMLEQWHTQTGWILNMPENIRPAARRAIPALEAMLQPATRQEMAVALDSLFAFAETLGKGPKNPSEASRMWAQALASLPADLLMTAVERTIKAHKFNTLPAPGEIIETVNPEMRQRRRWLHLARAA